MIALRTKRCSRSRISRTGTFREVISVDRRWPFEPPHEVHRTRTQRRKAMFRLASRPCFARHRGVSKNSGALRSVVVLKLGTDGVVGFILEGVSVDLGRNMLPVSPQISLSADSPLSTGTVECCRRARVSEFCFIPLSPEHTHDVNPVEG